jgi:hypothetical protein
VDDELEKAAGTPEGQKLAESMAAREYLDTPEGEMFQKAAKALGDARTFARDAHDALIGLTEPRWRGLSLRPSSATALRSQLAALREVTDSLAVAVDQMSTGAGS